MPSPQKLLPSVAALLQGLPMPLSQEVLAGPQGAEASSELPLSLGASHSGSQACFLVSRARASKGRGACLFHPWFTQWSLTPSFPVTAQKVSCCPPLQGRKLMPCWDMTGPKSPSLL